MSAAKWPKLTPQRGEHQVVHCANPKCAAPMVCKCGRRVPEYCAVCAKVVKK